MKNIHTRYLVCCGSEHSYVLSTLIYSHFVWDITLVFVQGNRYFNASENDFIIYTIEQCIQTSVHPFKTLINIILYIKFLCWTWTNVSINIPNIK
jgi:hypothetical protein